MSQQALDGTRPFRGVKVLVVEDETIVSFLIEDMLTELGCAAIWHAANCRAALDLLKRETPDVAVLDVNLGGETVYVLAHALDAAGIPFLFATGYGRRGLPSHWAQRIVIQKPFHIATLAGGLRSALAGSSEEPRGGGPDSAPAVDG